MTYHKFNNTYENYINNSLLSQMKNSINIIENFSSLISVVINICLIFFFNYCNSFSFRKRVNYYISGIMVFIQPLVIVFFC